VFLRVWQDEFRNINGIDYVQIARDIPRRQSPGFSERNSHIAQISQGADGYGVVCVAVDPETTGPRKIRSFNDKLLVKLGELYQENGLTFARVERQVSVTELARPKTAASTLADDLREIARKKIELTSKSALINARVGQGLFRKQVLSNWENACAVTGSMVLDAVRASHIKPWRYSTNEERLDSANGIPLIANLDALFDVGLITFDEVGCLLVSSYLPQKEHSHFDISGKRLRMPPKPETAKYLAYHRETIFRK